MFSLFRKEDALQPLSQQELLAATQTPVGDSLAGDGSIAEVCAPIPAAVPEPSAAPSLLDDPQPDNAASPPADDVLAASLADDHDGSEAAELAAPHDPEFAAANDNSWFEDLAEHRREHAQRPPRRRGRRLERPAAPEDRKRTFTAPQRLLLLDSWRRSGLPAGDFAALVGVSKHTLYKWNEQFKQLGPEGLMDQPRGARSGSRMSELTKRTILMLKENHPEWGCQRISDMLLRGPALAASPSSVARVLHEAGYEMVVEPTRAHPDKVRRFERAKPNQLWQTDLFTFMLKRQNRRVHLVAFMDDHSRFIVTYGLHASASTALVIEALEAGISSYGPPEEVLTDNGPQYVTWRGKSQFTKRLEQHGIRQIVARPRRPQTLGKVERFWGTLWREFLETAVFQDLADARTRIGLFIDYYNFQRVHRGVGGLVPADRFFGAATEVLRTLKERVAANSLELARHGAPRAPFYVTGQLDGQPFSVHAEGPRLILTRPGQTRQEVDLRTPAEDSSAMSVAETAADARERNRDTADPLPAPVCPDGSPSADVLEETLEETRSDEQPPFAEPSQPAGGDA